MLEQIQKNPEINTEQITAAFKAGEKSLYQLTADPSFHDVCQQIGIDPYATEKSEYWDLVSDYAQAQAEEALESGKDPLATKAFELLAATPSAIYAKYNCDTLSDAHVLSPDSVTRISKFSGLIRDFARAFPVTQVAQMQKAMLSTANHAVENPAVHFQADHAVRSTLHGAQHELAFGQIARATGRRVDQSTTEQDLLGIDYLVSGKERDLHIDVKASLNKISSRGKEPTPYRITSNATLTMLSMTRDSELGGMFFIPNELAHAKAPIVDSLLDQAENVINVQTEAAVAGAIALQSLRRIR